MLGVKSLAFHALIYCAIAVESVRSDLKLTLLHTNDMHSRFEDADSAAYRCQWGCFGGFARLKTAVDEARKEAKEKGRESLFMNAGDTFQGSIFFIKFRGSIVIPMLESLGLDVISLGNHEFDDLVPGFANFIENIKIPVVCSNIDYSAEPALKGRNTKMLSPSKVFELGPNKVKVGIIGYLTHNETANLGQVKLFEEVEPIKKEAARLKNEGVKILIALGHSGYYIDQIIAREVPDLDIVVGGHTDTFLYTGSKLPSTEEPKGPYPTIITQDWSNRKVLVVQTSGYTKYLGKLEVDFDDKGEIILDRTQGNPILIDWSVKKDPAVTALLQPYWDILIKDKVTRVIGHSSAFFAGNHYCRTRECNLGDMIADAFVYCNAVIWQGHGWTDAPISIINGGAIKASIDPLKYGGTDLTYIQLASALIHTSPLVKATITGEQLKQMLEVSVSNIEDPIEPPKEFLQVSGIYVLYDITKPAGQRVVQVRVRCGDCSIPKYEALNKKRKYRIILSRYLSKGNEGYVMFRNAENIELIPGVTDERVAVEAYLAHVRTAYPGAEGRIRFIEGGSDQTQAETGDASSVSTVSSRLWELLKESTRTQVLDRLPIGQLVGKMPLSQLLKSQASAVVDKAQKEN